MNSYIQIIRLVLVGVRKNYITKFHEGVNIIYGDSDTGKSSILEFINYLLGSSKLGELGDEVISSVKYAALELEINGNKQTIVRDIYDANALINVYPCLFDKINDYHPDIYSPNFNNNSAPNGFFSDYLMDSLNYQKVKIKKTPTKSSSEMQRLGFRSLFKYCYINQDDVGGKSFLDLGNWGKAAINREIFKYIFNVLDSNISVMQQEIGLKSQNITSTKIRYGTVSDFLRETECKSLEDIDETLDRLDILKESFTSELKALNENMISSNESYAELNAIFNELSLKNKSVKQELSSVGVLIDKYSRLKNDYGNDIKKLKSTLIARERIGQESEKAILSGAVPCPVCDQDIEIVENKNNQFLITSKEMLEQELSSLKSRKKDISSLIDTCSHKSLSLQKEQVQIKTDLDKVREMLDTETVEMITPFLTQRDSLIKEISSLNKDREALQTSLKMRNQQSKIHNYLENQIKLLVDLEEKLALLQESAPSLSACLSDLGDYFNKYLKGVNINKRSNISISKTSLAPMIRGKDYSSITSGGLRTICSIGHVLSILDYSYSNDINHPKLLLIDTVGKYLGKTTKTKYQEETNKVEDIKEGMSDPSKYRNMYNQIIESACKARELGVKSQIILVDNDVPDSMVETYGQYIVAHFSSIGEDGLDFGLIDDTKIK